MVSNISELKLSIIVPVYNVEKYLTRCIKSIEDQDIERTEYEILIVNDGTLDNSREIAVQLQTRNSSIQIIDRENGGLSSARNTGLDYARGKYIMFVDSDDYVEPQFVGKIIHLMDIHSLELCFFRTISRYKDGSSSIRDKQPLELYKLYSGSDAILNGLVITSVWHNLYLREFLVSTGVRFHEGIIHEDIPFNHILYPQAKRIMFTDICGYNYCHDGDSITRTQDISKIKKKYLSNLIGSKDISLYMGNNVLNDDVYTKYQIKMNSLLMSQLLSLALDKDRLGYEFTKLYMTESSALGLYPVLGKVKNLKNRIVLFLLNRSLIIRICSWLFSRIHVYS